jgi:hypothetical protein
MASRLLDAGYEVIVRNRSGEPIEFDDRGLTRSRGVLREASRRGAQLTI